MKNPNISPLHVHIQYLTGAHGHSNKKHLPNPGTVKVAKEGGTARVAEEGGTVKIAEEGGTVRVAEERQPMVQ